MLLWYGRGSVDVLTLPGRCQQHTEWQSSSTGYEGSHRGSGSPETSRASRPSHASKQSLMKLSQAIGVPFTGRQLESWIAPTGQLERGTGTTLPATIGPKCLLRGGSIPLRASERSNRTTTNFLKVEADVVL